MKKNTIKQWPQDDQPREKLLVRGADHLTDSELLAILLNNGSVGANAIEVAQQLLEATGHDLKKIAGLSVQDMINLKIKGLKQVKAVRIVAALELGVRRNVANSKRDIISRSNDISHYLRAKFEFHKQECFAVVFLNNGNKVIHFEIISKGGMNATVADPRIILKKTLEQGATSIILCHNHPGGHLSPSKADEFLTHKIKEGAAFLDIRVMDHIIVSNEGYFSFADEGRL